MAPVQTPHPTPDELAAFGLGKLDPEESAAMERHIAQCDSCCQLLKEIPDDTLVGLLRDNDTRSEFGRADGGQDPGTAAAGTAFHSSPSDVEAEPNASDSADSEKPGSVSLIGDIPEQLANHPRYQVERLLGKGGMGDVYLAQHRLMERTVAIKVINPEIVQRPEAVGRFQREVKAAARLSHPNIVTAYDAEEAGDLHILVMEYVEGRDLACVVKDSGPLSVTDACQYVAQAARGLQHAHDGGMVHRDIKPQNLMLTPTGEVKILDFGLAQFAREAVVPGRPGDGPGELTDAHSMMGTPDYMAPEQAQSARNADIRADVYGLGATLYFLLAGKPPFAGDSLLKKLKGHAQDDPPPLAEVRDDVPPELAAVLRRMMAKDPAERYQKPDEVAEALASYAQPTAPEAQPRRRFVRPAVLLGLAAAAVLAFGAIFTVVTDRGTLEIVTFDDDVQVSILKGGEEVTIIDTKTDNKVTLYAGEYGLKLSGGKGDLRLSTDTFTLRRGDKEIVHVRRVRMSPANVPVVPTEPLGELIAAKFSPDGEMLNARTQFSSLLPLVDPLRDAVGGQWRLERGELHTALGGEKYKRITIPVVPVGSYQLRVKFTRTAGISDVTVMLPAGSGSTMLALSAFEGTVSGLQDVRGQFAKRNETARPGSLSNDVPHTLLITVRLQSDQADVDVKLDDRPYIAWKGPQSVLYQNNTWRMPYAEAFGLGVDATVVFHSVELKMLDGVARRLETHLPPHPALLATLRGHTGDVRSVAVAPHGKTLATASFDGTVKLWDMALRKELATLRGHTGGINCVVFSSDGKTLASAGFGDKVVKLWDAATGKELSTLKGHTSGVLSTTFAPDGNTVASADWNGTIKVWDVAKGTELATFQGHTKQVEVVAFSPDGKLLASGSWDETVKLRDVDTWKVKAMLGVNTGVRSVVFSPDGKTLVTGSKDGIIKLWDVATRKARTGWQAHAQEVRALAFAPDGKTLASSSPDGTVKIWDASTGELLASYQESRKLWSIAFSHDGLTLLTGGSDGTVKLWDVSQWTARPRLGPHEDQTGLLKGSILAMSFEPNTIKTEPYQVTVRDLSGCGNDGLIRGPASTESGRVGSGLQLDGEDDYVLVPAIRDHLLADGAVRAASFSLWFRDDGSKDIGHIFDLGHVGDRSFSIVSNSTDGEIRFRVPGHLTELYGTKDCIATNVEQGVWHHFVGIWDGKTRRIYLDGRLEAEVPSRMDSIDSSKLPGSAARIGGQAKSKSRGNRFFKGLIDEFAVFARALSEEEIETLHGMGPGGRNIGSASTMSLPSESAPTEKVLPNGWVIHQPVNLGPTVNSSFEDGTPALSADGRTLLFHSNRPGGQGDADLWMCIRASASEPFAEPANLGSTVNSRFDDIHPALSADGLTLLFGSDRPGGKGSQDLWMCQRAAPGEPFGKPVNLGETVNSTLRENSPALSTDGLTLVFQLCRPGHRDVDLWMSTRAQPGEPFGEPVNLGPTVNSSAKQIDPALSADGLTLLFCSVRPGGQGDHDLWMSVRTSPSEAFGEPVNLGPTVNSRFPDGSPTLSADGRTLLFDSLRPGGQGDRDLWMARIEAAAEQTVLPKPKATLEGHADCVRYVAFSPDGKTLATASWDLTVKLWDLASSKQLATLEGHTDKVNCVVFAPDGKALATTSEDGSIKLWDPETGQERATFEGHADHINAIAFSPDGKTLASASDDGTAKMWEVATGTTLAVLQGHAGDVNRVVFAPDGKTLASISSDGTAKLWDAATGKELSTLSGHTSRVLAVAFSPDSKTLATGSKDTTIRLWDVATGEVQRVLEGHTHWLRSVEFSPDGKTLASGCRNGNVKLWDVATGRTLATLTDVSSQVWSVAFSPDGKTLAVATEEGTVKLWDASQWTSAAAITARAVEFEELIGRLKHDDSQVRAEAALKLGELGDKRGVEPLIAALGDEDKWVRGRAASALDNLGEKRAVEPLIDTLADEDRWVGGMAATALGNLGDQRAVEPLRAVLTDERGTVMTAAAVALAQLLDDERAVEPLLGAIRQGDDCMGSLVIGGTLLQIGQPAVEPLMAGLKDEDFKVRSFAAGILGMLGDQRAVAPLIAALDDTDWHVVRAAASALAELDDPKAVAPLAVVLGDKNSVLRRSTGSPRPPVSKRQEVSPKVGPAAVEALITALGDKPDEVRRAAAWVLGRLGDKRAAEPLAIMLGVDRKVERTAIRGDKRAAEVAAMLGVDHKAGKTAAEAPRRPGDERAVVLYLLTTEDARNVRRTAVQALGRLGDKRAVEPLTAILEEMAWNLETARRLEAEAAEPMPEAVTRRARRCADSTMDALVNLGSPAFEPLVAALKNENASMRLMAAYALGKIGPRAEEAIPELINILKREDDEDNKGQLNFAAAKGLGGIGRPAVPELRTLLRDGNSIVKMSAAYALSEMGPEAAEAIPELIEALGDEYKYTSATAAAALGAIGPAAIPELKSVLTDEDEQMRALAADALGAMGLPAVPMLIEALADPHAVVRARAAMALTLIGPAAKDAIPALEKMLNDEASSPRQMAAQALERIRTTP